jgi:hypothetical protein
MRTSKIIRITAALVLIAGTLPWAAGCQGTNTGGGQTQAPEGDGDAAPTIPPASSFLIDFDDFATDETAKAVRTADPAVMQGVPGGYWLWAAGNVVVWNTILTVTLVVPVAAYLESFNHDPELRADGTWVWAYDFRAGGVLHSAELHARTVEGNIEWNMYISKEGQFADVNWFSGLSSVPAGEGTWTLNRDPDNPTPFLLIEYEYDPEDEESGEITYTSIEEGAALNGSHVLYGTTGDAAFDAYYDIYLAETDSLVEIEWNRDTKDGRVRNLQHFGDEHWRCWDAALADVPCEGGGAEPEE